MNETESKDCLDEMWKNSPAYIIDWIRMNREEIKWYLIRLNKNIDEFLKEVDDIKLVK